MKLVIQRHLLLILLIATAFVARGQDNRYFRVLGPVPTTITTFTADGVITWTNQPTNATFIVQTASSTTETGGWVDFIQFPATNPATTTRLLDFCPPVGMTLIPAGSYTMGSGFTNDGASAELPAHTVCISGFYMDKGEVTKTLWDEVFNWATNNGYTFTATFTNSGPDHPVVSVDWYDCTKWCNARSEKEGRTPAYYTDAGQTNVYRTGQADLQADWVNWSAGYRLPTEAEWEKAARGGVSGRRFPWGDTVNETQANYYRSTIIAYDLSTATGYNPAYTDTNSPPICSNPEGAFAPNGYGLHDMIGNVAEWCWDKYSSDWYSDPFASQNDTRGPMGWVGDNSSRMSRGGSYGNTASDCRAASRRTANKSAAHLDRGFRSVLPAQS